LFGNLFGLMIHLNRNVAKFLTFLLITGFALCNIRNAKLSSCLWHPRPEIIKLAPVFRVAGAARGRVQWLHTGNQHDNSPSDLGTTWRLTLPGAEGSSARLQSLGCRRRTEMLTRENDHSVQGDTEVHSGARCARSTTAFRWRMLKRVCAPNLNQPFLKGLQQNDQRITRFTTSTERARAALQAEGIADADIHLTGNCGRSMPAVDLRAPWPGAARQARAFADDRAPPHK
jgi:hypothetical protein